jgi:hypothetical protein
MQTLRKFPFTYCLPDAETPRHRDFYTGDWQQHGGRWVIFNRRAKVNRWIEALAPYIDSGEIRQAKFYSGFTGDPSALIVYTLDREKDNVWRFLQHLGVEGRRLWEYEREMKGLRYKLLTIARSVIPGPIK